MWLVRLSLVHMNMGTEILSGLGCIEGPLISPSKALNFRS
jgi:hypothetical protein